MIDYTFNHLERRFRQFGFQWPNFHVIGIRAKDHVPDKFMDKIILIWGGRMYIFSGTTIPGVHWLQNLMNPKGTAVLKADMQYSDCYKLGLHKGNVALVQCGNLMVYRDNDKDNLAECIGEPVVAGPECRIDIHCASATITSVLIGKWSAGCQVLNKPEDWKYFIGFIQKYAGPTVTYTLLNEFDPNIVT